MDSSIELNFNLPLIQFQDQIREQFEWVMPETKSSKAKKREGEKKSREDEEKSLTAYDMILRHEEKSRGEKVRLPHNFSYMYFGKCSSQTLNLHVLI